MIDLVRGRRVSPEEMPYLASTAHRVFSKAGERLFDESARPAIWLVLSGDITLESATGAAVGRASAGNVLGLAQTMAGYGLEWTARAETDGVLLRIDRDELFDLLGDRSAMLRQIFAALFREARPPE